jgi:hypothetical protein
MSNNLIIQSWTIRGTNGTDLCVSENRDRKTVTISLIGSTLICVLNQAQWDAFHDLRYHIQVNKSEEAVVATNRGDHESDS